MGRTEVYVEIIERKQFKHQPTISKVAFNNSLNNTMVLDRDHREWQMQGERGGERYEQRERCEKGCNDVRNVATRNSTTRRQQ